LNARTEGAAEEFIRSLLADTAIIATTRSLEPDLFDEIRGIAEGAGLPEAKVIAFNLMDEQWWFRAASDPAPGCSVLALSGPARDRASDPLRQYPIVGQNMDLPAFMLGSQVMLRVIPDDAPEALVLTSAGLIGLTGANRVGVAVCVNALLMLTHSRTGLPVAVIVRGILKQRSARDAIAYASGMPHASGQQYLIAGWDESAGLECSASDVVRWTSSDDHFMAHTNHPLASTSIDQNALHALRQQGALTSSTARLEFLSREGSNVTGLTDVKRLLADRTVPICVSPSSLKASATFGSIAIDVTAPPRVEVCLGRPDTVPWSEATWTRP